MAYELQQKADVEEKMLKLKVRQRVNIEKKEEIKKNTELPKGSNNNNNKYKHQQ